MTGMTRTSNAGAEKGEKAVTLGGPSGREGGGGDGAANGEEEAVVLCLLHVFPSLSYLYLYKINKKYFYHLLLFIILEKEKRKLKGYI